MDPWFKRSETDLSLCRWLWTLLARGLIIEPRAASPALKREDLQK
jgi:hypothetical protein